MNELGYTFEEYLIRSAVNGVVDHLVKAKVDGEGNVSFFITDASTDAYICEFAVFDNYLDSIISIEGESLLG